MTFDLQGSLNRAEGRFGKAGVSRPRSDRGLSRLPVELSAELSRLLNGQERPPVRSIMSQLRLFCADRTFDVPARATIYDAMARTESRTYAIACLPAAVRETLYNLDPEGAVPGHQLAFYCLNYGGTEAASFAAGMPWLALYQAARMPGWRPRSRGLLEAIMRLREI